MGIHWLNKVTAGALRLVLRVGIKFEIWRPESFGAYWVIFLMTNVNMLHWQD